jgi:hypothetical protein
MVCIVFCTCCMPYLYILYISVHLVYSVHFPYILYIVCTFYVHLVYNVYIYCTSCIWCVHFLYTFLYILYTVCIIYILFSRSCTVCTPSVHQCYMQFGSDITGVWEHQDRVLDGNSMSCSAHNMLPLSRQSSKLINRISWLSKSGYHNILTSWNVNVLSGAAVIT